MTDLAKVAVVIDPLPAEQGAERSIAASQKTVSAFTSMDRSLKGFGAAHAQVTRDAQQMTEGLRRTYELAQADARERLARGLITPAEFRKLGLDAGAQFNQGLLSTISKQGDAGAFSGKQGQQFYADLAGQLKQVGPAAEGSSRGLKTITNSLAQLATTELGVRSGLGSLTTALGSFAVGAGVTLAVTAGIAALSAAWNAYTKDAREAKQRTDELIDTLNRASKERSGELFVEQEQDITRRIEELNRKARQALEVRRIETGSGATLTTGGSLTEELIAGYAEVSRAAGEFYAQQGERQREDAAEAKRIADEKAADAKRLADEQRRLFEERRGQLRTLAAAEAAARQDTGGLAALRIDAQVESMDRLTAAEQERYRTALLVAEAYNRQQTALKALAPTLERLNTAAAEAAKRGPLEWQRKIAAGEPFTVGPVDPSTFSAGAAGDIVAEAAAARREEAFALREQIDAMEEARQVAIGFTVGLGGLNPELGRALSGVSEYVNAMERAEAAQQAYNEGAIDGAELNRALADAAQQAQFALANVVASFGAIAFSGNSAADTIGRGAVGGIAAGIATGNPIVGVISGVGGIVGGLLGMGKKAEEEARRMREARKQWDRAFEELGQIGSLGGSQFARDIRNLKNDVEDAYDELKLAYPGTRKSKEFRPEDLSDFGEGGLARIRRAAAEGDEYAKRVLQLIERQKEALAELARLREQELGLLDKDQVARLAQLQGREDEAARLQLLQEQERRRIELFERYGDELPEHIRLQQEQIDLLEQEALARQQAIDAQRKAADAADAEGALRIRELRLGGADAQTVSRADLEEQAAAERRRAEILYASGEITLEFFNRLTAVIDGELNKSLADLEASFQKLNRQFMEDLEVRRLTATGQTEAAEERRIQLEQEREYDRMKAEGASLATLSFLDYIHTLEDQERATRKAEQAERDRIAALELAARAQEDLTVRLLRAKGQIEAAEDAATLFRQREEIRRYQEQGLDTAQLTVVQAEERAAADRERRRRQQEAFDQATASNAALGAAGADSRTTFNAAVGLTEGTGNRLAGLFNSAVGLASQQLLEQRTQTQLQRRMVVALERSGGIDPVGVATIESQRSIGQVPTNV